MLNRREFIKRLGVALAALPVIGLSFEDEEQSVAQINSMTILDEKIEFPPITLKNGDVLRMKWDITPTLHTWQWTIDLT